jgi:hypothetical protein
MAREGKMASKSSPDTNDCFVVSVIGTKGSEERVHADWFFEGIVKPTFSAHFTDFNVMRADHMRQPGMITTQIVEKLLNARLVIADMTFLNPNVFYEIGIRHMTGKPIVHAHHEGIKIPFDVSPYLSMEYSLNEHHQMMDAAETLRDMVEKAISPNFKVDNPVTQANGRAIFTATATEPDQLLLTQLESLSGRLSMLEQRRPPNSVGAETFLPREVRIASSKQTVARNGELYVTPEKHTSRNIFEKFVRDYVEPLTGEGVVLEAVENGYRLTYISIPKATLEEVVIEGRKRGVFILPL